MRLVGERELVAELAARSARELRVVVGGNFGTPLELLRTLDRAVPAYRLFVLNPQTPPPDRPDVTIETPFVGPGVRGRARVDYLPMRLSLVPRLFTTTHAPDIVLVQTTPPSEGRLSLGIEVNILPAAIAAARSRDGLVVAQLNSQMPSTAGDAVLSLDDVDLAFEASEPLPMQEPSASSERADAIGEHAASFVEDGATLQLGIGSVPDAVARQLVRREGLGVFTELLSDGLLSLERSGALDPERPIRASFLLGSAELYEWVDRNPRVLLQRTEHINDPSVISSQPQMVSINGAIEVDLHAQSNASHLADRVYSGFGGQPDFVSGALHSPGGHALIVLESWHERANRSKIVPMLHSPVTSFQHSAVVTEHGSAELFGHTALEQATALATRAADPRARAQLEDAARAIATR